jgi:hypothetical protein
MIKSRINNDQAIIQLAQKALQKKFHGYTPDSTIPIVATIEVEEKHWVKKNGILQAIWQKQPTLQCMLDDLLTNNGRDVIHQQSFLNGGQPAQFAYYAISSDATFSVDFTAGSTTINNEIITPTHMVRHLLTQNWGGVTESYTHSAGTNTTTCVASFENNTGSGSLSVYGYGNANAASGVTIGFGSSFTGVTLNSAAGAYDVLKLTVTLTLG